MLLSGLTCILASLSPAVASARDTPYCKQVRARAQSDADLLMMPRVLVQGIRFPEGAQQFDSGATTAEGYQLRAGFSFSPIDFYKGRATLDVGAAECDRHEAELDLDAVLSRGTDDARLGALREQGVFLRAKSADWRALQARAAARLDKRIITVVEFTNVQHFVDALERKLVQVEGDASQLDARSVRTRLLAPSSLPSGAAPTAAVPAGAVPPGVSTPPAASALASSTTSATLPSLAGRYLDASVRYEREVSSLRRLDEWRLQMTGGVIPQTPSDWYGTIELSFSLGGLVRGAHEEQYIRARSETLARATDGVDLRLRQFRDEITALLGQAERDLSVVEHSLEVLRATRTALQSSEAESVAQAREILTIEQLSVESDSVFLRALVRALQTLAERARS
ncbi:MAG TPA: hypothetical protein VMG12_41340 [Polyangiaceae bacterium]|nr:hypothetical protein [Polyangiaceae bacterium]